MAKTKNNTATTTAKTATTRKGGKPATTKKDAPDASKAVQREQVATSATTLAEFKAILASATGEPVSLNGTPRKSRIVGAIHALMAEAGATQVAAAHYVGMSGCHLKDDGTPAASVCKRDGDAFTLKRSYAKHYNENGGNKGTSGYVGYYEEMTSAHASKDHQDKALALLESENGAILADAMNARAKALGHKFTFSASKAAERVRGYLHA